MVPNAPIALEDIDKKILGATLERNMVSLAALGRYVGTTDWSRLVSSVKKLQANNLVQVSGNIWDEKDSPYATVGINPSTRSFVYDVLRQSA